MNENRPLNQRDDAVHAKPVASRPRKRELARKLLAHSRRARALMRVAAVGGIAALTSIAYFLE